MEDPIKAVMQNKLRLQIRWNLFLIGQGFNLLYTTLACTSVYNSTLHCTIHWIYHESYCFYDDRCPAGAGHLDWFCWVSLYSIKKPFKFMTHLYRTQNLPHRLGFLKEKKYFMNFYCNLILLDQEKNGVTRFSYYSQLLTSGFIYFFLSIFLRKCGCKYWFFITSACTKF